jgi:hypothetical protein
MSETKRLMRHARRLYNCGVRSTDRHNRKAWVRSVAFLGDRWLLAQPVRKARTKS